ncbi:MAG: hypothetical protein SGPRY_012228, partial [Prymnesium sp.]
MHHHPLWDNFDLVVESAICDARRTPSPCAPPPPPSPFFAEQLTAFKVWLKLSASGCNRRPPAQLPILLQALPHPSPRLALSLALYPFHPLALPLPSLSLLSPLAFPCTSQPRPGLPPLAPLSRTLTRQVLLSPTHRLRALLLLGSFVGLGAWAVGETLAVGIFPYVLKLLASHGGELRSSLLYLWARILLHDTSCQVDLLREAAHSFFIELLRESPPAPPLSCVLALFVLSAVCHAHPEGQASCIKLGLPALLASLLDDAIRADGGGGGGAVGVGGMPKERSSASTVSSPASTGGQGEPSPYRPLPQPHTSRQERMRHESSDTPPPEGLAREEALLLHWICLCLAQLCDQNEAAQLAAHRAGLPARLRALLFLPEPE